MKIETLNGYELHLPTSGGRAGHGHNQTTSLQVRKDGMIVKQFRFDIHTPGAAKAAAAKAKQFILSQGKVT